MTDPDARKQRGRSGEAHARAFLEGRGLRFVEANWRCRAGELDLVMRDGGELAFIEVKTRTGTRYGTAAEAVTSAKARRLLAAAAWYVAEHPDVADAIWRIDIVAVTIDPATGEATVEHLENAVVEG